MYNIGAPGRIRTCDLELRSLLLYPAELPGPIYPKLNPLNLGTPGIWCGMAESNRRPQFGKLIY
jgi:hypothetical protein